MKRKKKRKEKGKEKGKGKGKEKGKRNGKEKRNKGKEKGEIKWSSLLLFESILYAMLRNSLKNRCTNNYIGCKVKHKDMSQPGLSFSQPPTYTSYHQHWLHVLKLIAVSIWVFSELYEEYSVKKSRSYSHMYLCAVSKSCLLFSIDIFHILDMGLKEPNRSSWPWSASAAIPTYTYTWALGFCCSSSPLSRLYPNL